MNIHIVSDPANDGQLLYNNQMTFCTVMSDCFQYFQCLFFFSTQYWYLRCGRVDISQGVPQMWPQGVSLWYLKYGILAMGCLKCGHRGVTDVAMGASDGPCGISHGVTQKWLYVVCFSCYIVTSVINL